MMCLRDRFLSFHLCSRIDACSLYEEDSEQGYAHLIEHLAFRGLEHVPDGEAKRVWQRFGVTFGSDSNAQTTPTQTVYQLDLPNAKTENARRFDEHHCRNDRKPSISQAALDAERQSCWPKCAKAVARRWSMPTRVREHVFQGQRMAKRSPIPHRRLCWRQRLKGLLPSTSACTGPRPASWCCPAMLQSSRWKPLGRDLATGRPLSPPSRNPILANR